MLSILAASSHIGLLKQESTGLESLEAYGEPVMLADELLSDEAAVSHSHIQATFHTLQFRSVCVLQVELLSDEAAVSQTKSEFKLQCHNLC